MSNSNVDDLESLLRWERGDVLPGPVAFLESARHIPFARKWATELIAPAPVPLDATELSEPRQVGYEGNFTEPGDEILLGGDIYVYQQDYTSTPYLAVAGPTVVRMSGPDDFEAYLEDADLARRTGTFVEQLIHPAVFLSDLPALGRRLHGLPSKRYVTSSGEVRSGPSGVTLGDVESSAAELAERARAVGSDPASALAGVVPPAMIDAAVAQRPWLPRYLDVIDLLRGLLGDGRTGHRVSGFGHRLVGGLDPDVVEAPDAPLVVWRDDEYVVFDPKRQSASNVGADAARLIEMQVVLGDENAAASYAAEYFGMGVDEARHALATVTASLGEPVPAGSPARG